MKSAEQSQGRKPNRRGKVIGVIAGLGAAALAVSVLANNINNQDRKITSDAEQAAIVGLHSVNQEVIVIHNMNLRSDPSSTKDSNIVVPSLTNGEAMIARCPIGTIDPKGDQWLAVKKPGVSDDKASPDKYVWFNVTAAEEQGNIERYPLAPGSCPSGTVTIDAEGNVLGGTAQAPVPGSEVATSMVMSRADAEKFVPFIAGK